MEPCIVGIVVDVVIGPVPGIGSHIIALVAQFFSQFLMIVYDFLFASLIKKKGFQTMEDFLQSKVFFDVIFDGILTVVFLFENFMKDFKKCIFLVWNLLFFDHPFTRVRYDAGIKGVKIQFGSHTGSI